MERVRRRGAENRKYLLWRLQQWDWWRATKVCSGSHLPTAGCGKYCIHAVGLEIFSSRGGVKYPWPRKSACGCLQMARWMSGFDIPSRGDIPMHWTRWLQPLGMGFPRVGRGDGCGERAKNPSAALLGASKGKCTQDKMLLAPVARQGRRWPCEAHVCTCN